MKTLAIVGSRNFNDYELMCNFIFQNISAEELAQVDTVVSGGARGADTLAERFAHEHNLKLIVHPAQWEKYGRAAGPKRNKLIIEDADIVVAFPTASSTGTYNSIKLARKAGKRLEVCNEALHQK